MSNLPGSDLSFAAAAWVVVALVWLIAALQEPRGREWHIALAAAPFAGFAMAASANDALSRLGLLWLQMGGVIFCSVAIAWIWGTLKRNHGVMDVFYSLSVLAAAVAGAAGVGFDPYRSALLVLIVLWSIRLAAQTFAQNHTSERAPYSIWRRRGGQRWFWWSFFQVHLLQGVTVWIWCLALAAALAAPQPQSLMLVAAGAVVWSAGFMLQAVADLQLAAFKRDPDNRGKLLDSGVWAFVRHPNYLGEALMWWGMFVFALAHPWGPLAVISPLFASWFLGYSSAAPFKEQHMAKTRGEVWTRYCERTPRFLPWPRSGRVVRG